MNAKGSAHLVLLAIAAVVVVGGTVTSVAADSSKPGDALYSIDRGAESVREKLVFGEDAKTEFEFAQATERLEELEALRNEDAPADLVEEASDNYGQAIGEAANALAEIAKNGGDIDEALAEVVTEATSVHLDVLARVYESVPDEAKDSIQKAMVSSEQGTEQTLEAINGSVSEERRQRVEEKVEQSKALRGRPESVPGEGSGSVEAGRSNAPVNPGRP